MTDTWETVVNRPTPRMTRDWKGWDAFERSIEERKAEIAKLEIEAAEQVRAERTRQSVLSVKRKKSHPGRKHRS